MDQHAYDIVHVSNWTSRRRDRLGIDLRTGPRGGSVGPIDLRLEINKQACGLPASLITVVHDISLAYR